MQRNTGRVLSCFILLVFFISGAFAGPVADNRALFVTGYHSDISPGLELLIDQSLLHQKTKDTLSLINSELEKDPTNTTLMYKKASIYADQGLWNNTLDALNQIILLQPSNTKANALIKIVDEKKRAEPHNEIGFDLDEAYVSDLSTYWNYSSIHYYRLTDGGKFGGHVNHANRYGSSGTQYQLEAYPKLSKNAYAELSLGYADTGQIIFPTLQYNLEGYIDTANNLEFSLGQGGKHFAQFSNQNILSYTGTIGKNIGSSFIWFRPTYFTPKKTWFYQVGLRKYFSDPNNYMSVVAAIGRIPDLGDVPPFDQMIIISQKGIGIVGQVSLSKSIFLKGGIGYVKQLFPSGLRREITDASIGLVLRI
ncbi:MAG: hypothetical protein RJA83_84 [Pseudomonadota bacterium]|jgi:YaiO family outer membrane protein